MFCEGKGAGGGGGLEEAGILWEEARKVLEGARGERFGKGRPPRGSECPGGSVRGEGNRMGG